MSDGVKFSEALVDCGRNDSIGNYHKYEQYDSDKHEQRLAVARFFEQNSGDWHLKPLTFPGTEWLFELLLIQRNQDQLPQFVGLEHSSTVFHNAKRCIPGRKNAHYNKYRRLHDRLVDYGNSTIVYASVASHKSNDHIRGKRVMVDNRLLLMDLEAYTSMLSTDYGATLQQKEYFIYKFFRRNAVWLDFTGCLTPKVETALSNLPLCFESVEESPIKPVVITVLNGRDRFSSVEQRIAAMVNAQPSLTYVEHWTYTGKGGVSMLTACFVTK